MVCYGIGVVEKLRDAQRRMARERIMQAAADLIVEEGLEALSLADVVARAGVSRRTLYNHFDSREMLLAEIGRWSDELTLEQGGALRPDGLDTLPDVVQAVWRTWAAQGTLHQAVLRIDAASSESGISESRRARRAAMAEAILAVRPDLTTGQANDLASLLHAMTSAPVFERMTSEDGLSVEAAGALVGWALTVLRDALNAGNTPYDKENSP